MCNLQVDKDAIETQFGIDFDSYFADALEILGEMEADCLVGGTHSRKIEVTEAGRPLLRVICRSFDKYMSALSRPQKVSNSLWRRFVRAHSGFARSIDEEISRH